MIETKLFKLQIGCYLILFLFKNVMNLFKLNVSWLKPASNQMYQPDKKRPNIVGLYNYINLFSSFRNNYKYFLFYRYRLRQIPGLIYIASAQQRNMIR